MRGCNLRVQSYEKRSAIANLFEDLGILESFDMENLGIWGLLLNFASKEIIKTDSY